jgi:hypothetical protein
MHARQLLADAHSRIQRRLVGVESLLSLVETTEASAFAVLDTLPVELAYSHVQYHAFKDQRPVMVHLHVMRNTCYRHAAMLRILAYQISGQHADDISRQRNRLIQNARQLSTIFSDAIKYEVVLDPQTAMHAYNAIESKLPRLTS